MKSADERDTAESPDMSSAKRREPDHSTISDEILRVRIREAASEMRQPPLWHGILSAPLASVIMAGLIGAWLSGYYDHQRLKTENELIKSRASSERIETQRDMEIARAFTTFEEVSKLLDKRLWRTRRLIWAVDKHVSQNERERRWMSYRDPVDEWNDNRGRRCHTGVGR